MNLFKAFGIGVIAVVIVAVAMSFMMRDADAHSGGTDKYGCHAGSKPRHCHSKSKPVVTRRSTSTSPTNMQYKTKFFKCEKQMKELESSKTDADDRIDLLLKELDRLYMENAHLRGELLGK